MAVSWAIAYLQRISGTKSEKPELMVNGKSVESNAKMKCWTTSGSESSSPAQFSSAPDLCQVAMNKSQSASTFPRVKKLCSYKSHGSYDMVDAEDLATAGFILNSTDTLMVHEVKFLSKTNSFEDYVMVTNTDSSAREPEEEEGNRGGLVRCQNSLGASDVLPCILTSAETSDGDAYLECASTSLARAISSLESSIGQVSSRANDSLMQGTGELQSTREPFMEAAARVESDGGAVFDREVGTTDDVSKGDEISNCAACSNDCDLSNSLMPTSSCCYNSESGQDTSSFNINFSASGSALIWSSPNSTGVLPTVAGTTDTVEVLSQETRSLDALRCSNLQAGFSRESCTFSVGRRNVSDPGPKPVLYIKRKAISNVLRSISEPNEKDLIASEMLKLVERPEKWSLQRESTKLAKHRRMPRHPTEHSIKKCIEKNCSEFLDYTNWKCLLPHLMSNQLLDRDTCECLMNNFSTNLDKGLHFYIIVLPSKGSTAYSRFYDSIAQEPEHIGHRTLLERMNDFTTHS